MAQNKAISVKITDLAKLFHKVNHNERTGDDYI
jgi:hypothetical protein